jgi:hypothetical protein
MDDLGKFYKQRRRATQVKGLEILDPKAEAVQDQGRNYPHGATLAFQW